MKHVLFGLSAAVFMAWISAVSFLIVSVGMQQDFRYGIAALALFAAGMAVLGWLWDR